MSDSKIWNLQQVVIGQKFEAEMLLVGYFYSVTMGFSLCSYTAEPMHGFSKVCIVR